jgi:hypothetical protein
MSEMNVRSDSVDVEQIMRQIRARIREKRGADYTEAELQQLATVKLETFLDPRGLRSDLVQHFRQKQTAAPSPPNFAFEEDTLFETHRGFLRTLRGIFKPFLKLFFNPDRLTTALHLQSQINTQAEQRLRSVENREMLAYELLHNMTVEITRLGIEVHNLKMRVESLSSRVDFDERRAKAFEGVVQYRTPASKPSAQATSPTTESGDAGSGAASGTPGSAAPGGEAGGGERRRRRRRRRRRPGSTMADAQGQNWSATSADAEDDGPDDEAADESPDATGGGSTDPADQ